MNRLSGWLLRVVRAFRRSRFEADMAGEMSEHLERETTRRIAAGEDPAAARRNARIEFGHGDSYKEQVRDARLGRWLEDLSSDLRFALRGLRKSPMFTMLAVLILTIGIGSATTIFSVINAVLLRDLPFADSDRVVRVAATRKEDGHAANQTTSGPLIGAWRERATSFEHFAIFEQRSGVFNPTNRAPRLTQTLVASPDLYDICALPTQLGRRLTSEDAAAGAEAVVVLSHETWVTEFNRDDTVIGQHAVINSQSFRVVGVLAPRAFLSILHGTAGPDFLLPFREPIEQLDRGLWNFNVVAKLLPGVTVSAANAEMHAIAEGIQHELPEVSEESLARVVSLKEDRNRIVRPALWATATLVSLLLLITVVNGTKLALVRTITREGEFAVRSALGASRGRLTRQLLAESGMLAALGGLGGVLFALWGVNLLANFGPVAVTSVARIAFDSDVVLFAVVTSAFTTLAITSASLWRVKGIGQVSESATRTTSSGRRQMRLLRGLVTAQFAVATAVLVAAGLMLVSFVRLTSVDPGFAAESRLSFRIVLPSKDYPDHPSRLRVFDRIRDEVRALPGVTAVTGTNAPPLSGHNEGWGFWFIDGRSDPEPQPVQTRVVMNDYFSTMSIQLVRGRRFDNRDNPAGPKTVVINERLAQNHFGAEDPIGRTIKFGWQPEAMEVIGIARNVQHHGLREESSNMIYVPAGQLQVTGLPAVSFVVHGQTDPTTLVSSVRTLVSDIDSGLPVSNVSLLDDWVKNAVSLERSVLQLLVFFSGVTVLLTTVGLYGVVSYLMRRRRRELGIRVAVGAQRSQIAALVYRQGARVVLAGIAIGIFVAWSGSRVIDTLLYQVETTDPWIYSGVAVVLIASASLALGLPAHRAAKINPVEVLRAD